MSWKSLLSMADVYSQGMAGVHEDLRRQRLFAEATCTDDGSQFPVHLVLLYATYSLFRETSPGGNLPSPPCTINVPAVTPGVAVAIAPAEIVDAAISTTKQGQQSAAPPEAGEVRNITVAGVCGDVMGALLEYVYTNRVTLNSDNVLSMLLAAHRFKVAKANQDLLRSSYDDPKALLSSDDLNVADEAKAFSVTIKSTSAGAPSRHLFLTSLLSAIRFGLCKASFLHEEGLPHPMLDDVDCHAVLEPVYGLLDQVEIHEGPRMINLTHPMLRPRIPRDLLFVIGGWGCDTASNLVERYGYRSNRWLIFPNDRNIMPQVYHHGLVVLDGLVYLIRGSDRSQCFNCVRCFNLLQHRWTERTCWHTARCYVSVAVLDGKIYALGGYDGDRRTNTAERCVPATNTWSLIANMNDQRSDACATVVDLKATRYASTERKQRRLDQWIALLGRHHRSF